jgi:glycosyltransferase involved in cell wall biosynthesis
MSRTALSKTLGATVVGRATGKSVDAHARSPQNPPRPLRVLEIVESSGGGTGRHVLDLAEGLAAHGCNVHVLYSPRRADRLFLERVARLSGVRATPLWMHTGLHPSDLFAVRSIRRYLRKNGPFDVIHGHSSKGGALARLAGFRSGAAIFYTLHGLIMMDPGLAWWKRSFYLAIERTLSAATAAIIAVSPEEARAAVRLGLGQSRVITIPNGVGLLRCTRRSDARRALGIGDAELLVGFVGRLVTQKAPHVLLQAFAEVAREVPHARLVMVGDGPLRGDMDRFAQALGVGTMVLWLGERDAREVLAALDIFALSSRKEGLPYVVLEAMAVGLPVVATASSGVESLIEQGVNGSIVATDDSLAFARALLEIGRDDARRRAMGKASLRLVQNFSIDSMVDRTLQAYVKHRCT